MTPARTDARPSRRAEQSAAIEASCPLCRSTAGRCADASPIDGPWRIVSCDCGLCYTSPRPPDGQWEKWYGEDYGPHRLRAKRRRWHTPLRERLDRRLLEIYRGYAPGEADSRTRRLLATLFSPILGRLLNPYFLPPHGGCRLLDFGCGTGKYMARMRDLGWEVLGVDRSSRAVSLARELAGVPAVLGTLPEDREVLAGEPLFDLATCWEVLEHVDDPAATLASIRELLLPTGRLVLTVPNFAGWGARFFGREWIGLDLPRHLTHFTPATLEAMLRATGYRVVHRTTIAQSGWLRHSARRARPVGVGRLRRLLSSKLISRTSAAIGARWRAGESLYVVAERQ